MISSKFLLLLFIILSVVVNCNIIQPRVMGGNKCNISLYPYVVSLVGDTLCGGSLVTSKWVLTAAHCIQKRRYRRGDVRVVAARQDSSQKRFAIKGVRHKNYIYPIGNELRYDIGMILVDEPFATNEFVSIATLPKVGFTETCEMGTVVGSGLTGELNQLLELGKVFYCVDLPFISLSQCSEEWPDAVIDGLIICTALPEGGKDSCYGDSGGPLVCDKVVIGIVSMGKSCGLPDSVSTYTRVESFLHFINNTIITGKCNKLNTNIFIKLLAIIIIAIINFD